jgi:hypothetical protein
MHQVQDRLYVGDDSDCLPRNEEWTVVHACKHPCHQDAVGYTGSLGSSHPHYLSYREGDDLYLNMIDPDRPMFMPEMFEDFFAFSIPRWEDGDRLLIHCNQGRSRSPSLSFLLMAAKSEEVPGESFAAARRQFEEMYPPYRPSRGIEIYLQSNWDGLTAAATSA